jgi:membrane fusion protein
MPNAAVSWTAPETPAPTAADPPLFRDEALAGQRDQWLGAVMLNPRLSHRVFAGFAVLVVILIVALLFGAGYSRKVKVAGWLVPAAGTIRVFAPHAGLVTNLRVTEGTTLQKGDPILSLSNEVDSSAMGPTQGEIVRHLRERYASLVEEESRQQELVSRQTAELTGQLAAKRAQEAALSREYGLKSARLDLAVANVSRQHVLRDRQLATEERVQQAEQDQLDQAVALQSLSSARATAEQERIQLEAELNALPLNASSRRAESARTIASLAQELAEAEARREIVVAAPVTGTVTAIQVSQGGMATDAMPLLTIVADGSPLQAELFAPSKAIGLLQPGQTVRMRYSAFPYQKFGFYDGRIATISRTSLSPAELPQRETGLTSLYDATGPIYPIAVTLANQQVISGGQAVPLQAGMQLEADVLIERRSLFEWILTPLLSMRGA